MPFISGGGGLTSPLSTKGDLFGYSTTNARLPVGTDGQALFADSTQTLGIGWKSGASQVLFSSVLGADTAAIDTGANGIAAGFTVLEAWFLGRTTQAAVLSTLKITVNNDSGANYDWESVAGSNVTASASLAAAGTSWASGAIPGANATAGQAAVFCITIPFYAATTFRKQGTLLNVQAEPSVAGDNFAIAASLGYRATTAISRMAFTAGSGNLLTGSSVIIYGR